MFNFFRALFIESIVALSIFNLSISIFETIPIEKIEFCLINSDKINLFFQSVFLNHLCPYRD